MRIDAHCDTICHYFVNTSLHDIETAHLDFRRLRQYLDVSFFAIFVETIKNAGKETEKFDFLLQALTEDIAQQNGDLALLRQKSQLRDPHQKLIVVGAEGAACCGVKAEHLQRFFEAGLRFVGLTWNNDNRYAGGCAGDNGISAEGRDLIAACNSLGILIDGAHLSPRSFWQLTQLTEVPFMVSHTCCATLNPHPGPYPRNLTDQQLQAVAVADGVVGISFVPDFLGGTASVDRICDHIEHAATIMGIEHVAIGSDFDGAPLPNDMQGVQSLPLIYARLQERGMSAADVSRVAGDNLRDLLLKVLPE